jgi:hypothetical protein
MKNQNCLVEVVIPIYKKDISILEKKSLQQVCDVLSRYPLIVVKPASLDLSELLETFPLLKVKSFDDIYFKGISGYNRLMLSDTFYSGFSHTKYILIYQLDAYVFCDELTHWCETNYDYIGAPWLKKPIYNIPIISLIMKISRKYHIYKGRKNKQELYNKIGNGGFSLRKVDRHYEVTIRNREKINFFLEQKGHLYNEDVFWATIESFKYPKAIEALAFAFDKYPSLCYKLNNRRLPFGCHGWYKRKMKSFWKPIIGF